MRKSSRRKSPSSNFEPEQVKQDVKKPQNLDRVIPQLETVSISINWDSLNTRRKITADLRDEICDFYYSIQKNSKDQIPKLKERIEEYSDIQIFYNYLENAYREEDNIEKASEIAILTAKKFPEFIFGKVSQIELCLESKELDKISDLLQGKFEYRLLYPEKATFHIQEIIAFNFAIGKYFALRADVEKANECLENIKGIDPDHIFVKQLQKFISKNSGLKFYQKVLNKLK